jgi:hypothetical protein
MLASMPRDAAAQTITHEVNGRPYTYDFKRSGAKNLPWDEPGKIYGVPGVDDRRGTSLPAALTTTARKPVAAGQTRVRIPVGQGSDAAQHDKAEVRVSTRDLPLPGKRETLPATDRAQGHQPAVTSPSLGKDALSADEAEIRAKIIADSAAKALAEEQRRLAVEKSRDRRAPYSEARSSSALPVVTGPDPATTGTIASATPDRDEPVLAPEPRASTDRKGGICRLLFFGAC